MKKIIIPAIMLSLPVLGFAQSTVDAYSLSQTELRGTARFMSMGGAFTALGGDLSTLSQNPAGVAVYRGSEIGATLDLNFRSYNTQTPYGSSKDNQTKVFCNNFGYVGTAWLGSGMRSISWGVTYGRVSSFDRVTNGYNNPTSTSLTNYVAGFSGGQSPSDLSFEYGSNGQCTYNPYLDSDCDWLSILAYTSYMISPRPGAPNQYLGLYQNGTVGDALYNVRERGYVDQYNFDLGGNVSDMVYWGLGIGVTDISYTRDAYYSESMENARIMSPGGSSLTTGDAGFDLYNSKHITGNGWNFKAGVIVKPVPALRLGFAVHTPTYYTLTHGYEASTNFSYYDPSLAKNPDDAGHLDETQPANPQQGDEYTEWASFDSRLRTPWRIMAGAALVIGNQAIVSVDYEHQAYNDMQVKYQYGYGYDDFAPDDNVNNNIKDVFKGSDIVRLGIEYRVTPQLSLRAGYNAQKCNVKQAAVDGNVEVLTSGTDPSFSLDSKLTQYISCGLGYKYKGWYFDAAYVHKNRESKFRAYTNWDGNIAPSADVKENYNSVVLSVGYKF